MTAKVTIHGYEVTFDDSDVVNASEYGSLVGRDGKVETRYGMKAFLIHDQGFTVAVVFADTLQNAIDEAADSGRLDRWKVSSEELAIYGDTEEEQSERLHYLGNAGEPFDTESLSMFEIPLPAFSFAGLVRTAANDIAHGEWLVDAAKTARLERSLSLYDMMIDYARCALRNGDPAQADAYLARAVELRDEDLAAERAARVAKVTAGEKVTA